MSASFYLRKFGKLGAFVCIVIVVIVSSVIVVNRFFQIQEIEVIGSSVRIAVDKDKIPKSLIFFPTHLIEKQMEADNPLIAKVEIEKKYPHTLVIILTQRQAVAELETLATVYSIDSQGYVLNEKPEDAHVPVIVLDIHGAPVGGKISDGRVLSALSFITLVSPMMIIDTVKQFDSTSFIAKTDKADILFPQHTDITAVAATLQTLFSGFRIKGTLPTRIDLRFEKPIVTF